ncbi:glycosyltransferase [Azospirillum sp. ST 5-10]|uniref:glycosyltransferase n=1 Tax=unclassified Azospirillum TaxID=2630922 RepID=UPI003F49C752
MTGADRRPNAHDGPGAAADGWSAATILVSVILPVGPDTFPGRALRSALGQSHARLDVVLVGDPGVPPSPSDAALLADPRVRLVAAGDGDHLLNTGMAHARGRYFAFLDPRDAFAPDKLALQVAAMARAGRAVSHTSYALAGGGGAGDPAVVPSGRLNGVLYPGILADCPVAVSTLMIHRTVFLSGFRVHGRGTPADDALTVIWLAQRHEFLGLDAALASLDPSHAPASLDPRAALARLDALWRAVAADPNHARCTAELARLDEARRSLAEADEVMAVVTAHRRTGDSGPVRAAIRRLIEKGEWERAQELFELLPSDDPEDTDLPATFSRHAEEAGDVATAVAWMERRLEAPNPPAQAFTRCMYLHRALGDWDKAIQTIFHGRAHHPDAEDLRLQTLSLLIERGARGWARAEAEGTLALGITLPILARLATMALIDGDAPAEVLARADAAIRPLADAEPGLAALCRFQLLTKAGRGDEAAEVLMGGLIRAPGHVELALAALFAPQLQPSLPAYAAAFRDAAATAPAVERSDLAELASLFEAVGGETPLPYTWVDVEVLERVARDTPPPVPRPGGPVMVVCGSLARGGAERLLALAFDGLRRRLHPRPVDLVVLDCSEERGTAFYLPQTGLSRDAILSPRDVPRIEAPYKWLQRPDLYQWLIDLMEERRPAAVYAGLEGTNQIAGLAAVRTGVPRIVLGTFNMRPSDTIDDTAACHWYREGYRSLLRRPEVHLTSLSPTCVDDYVAWLDVDLATRATIVPSGFDMAGFRSALDACDRAQARRHLGIDPGVPVVGVVMRIAPPKAPLLWVDVAAAVARRRPDALFVVIGDGELRAAMQDAAATRGLAGAFRFVGAVADVYAAFPAFDVFLLTSSSEGVPNVLVEAQASGLPVVARRVGAVADAMVPGRSGQAVAGDEAGPLADAVLAYLDDPALARRAGAEGKAFARERFDLERMLDRLQTLVGA